MQHMTGIGCGGGEGDTHDVGFGADDMFATGGFAKGSGFGK